MAQTAKEPPAAAPARRRGAKWWAIALALLALGILALPALASTGAGAAYLSRQASAAIPGSLVLEGVRLSWTGGQSVAGIAVLDFAGEEVATATKVSLPDLSLLDLLGGQRDPGSIVVESAWAKVEIDARGNSGLQAALADPAAVADPTAPPAWAALGRVQLGSAQVEITSPQLGAVLVEVGAFLALPSREGVSLTADATIGAGGGEGQATVALSISMPEGTGMEEAGLGGEIEVLRLPMALLDTLLGNDLPSALVGSMLDAKVDVSGNLLAPRLAVEASGPSLAAFTATLVAGESISLAQPATLSMRLLPEAWDALVASAETAGEDEGMAEPARLTEPAEITLRVESLTIPKRPDGALDMERLALAATLTAGRMEFAAGEEGGAATVSNLEVQANTQALGGGLEISVDALLGHGGLAAPVAVAATVGDLTDPTTPPSWQVAAEATALPVAAAGVLLGQAEWPALLLGETADMALEVGEVRADGGRGWRATLTSPNLDLDMAGAMSTLSLQSDPAASTVGLRLTPAAVAGLAAAFASAEESPLQLAAPASLGFSAVDLTWLMAARQPAFRLAATLTSSPLELGRAEVERVKVADLAASLTATAGLDGLGLAGEVSATVATDGASGTLALVGSAGWPEGGEGWFKGDLGADGLPPGALDTLLATGGRLAPLLGGPALLDVAADTSTDPPNLSLTLASPNLVARLSLHSDEVGGVAGTGTATLHLTPAAYAAWSPAEAGDQAALLAPADITVALARLEAPGGEAGPDWAMAAIGATVEIPLLSLAPAGAGPGAVLEELDASLWADVLGQSARLRATASFAKDGVMAPTSADLTLTGLLAPDGAAPGVAGRVALERLGLGALAAALGAPGSVTALVGDSAEATMDLDLPAGGAGAGSATIAIEGDLISLSLEALLQDGRLALASPATARLRLTPAGFAAIGDLFPPASASGEAPPKPPLRLLAPTDLTLTVASLDLPWGGEGAAPGAVALEAMADSLTLAREGTPGRAVVSGLSGTLEMGWGPGGRVEARAAALLVEGGVASPATLSLSTLWADPEAPDDAQPLNLEVRGSALPMPTLDLLMGTGGMLEALVGPLGSMDLALALPASGPGRVDLDLTGAVSTVSAHGPVDPSFTLDNDALATLEVTPALGARVLALVNPLLMTALSGDGPVVATVAATTMSLPLRPFSVPDARADIIVEIGTVEIGHGGLVEAILKALGQRQPERSLATFTPARITLANGALTYSPVTMTMGDLQVTLQGVVDVESRGVNATLSLPKASLAPVLGDLADLLEDGYVLVVPVGGTVDAPEIDRGAIGDALGDLLARLAIRALAGSLFGG